MRQLVLILLLDILGAGLAFSAPAPLPQTDVFTAGLDGYAAYRIPALAAASDGTLLAFAEARKTNLGDPGAKGNTIDLVVKRSTDGGRTWSPLQIIEAPGELWSAANPAPLLDRQTGRLWLHYVRCRPGAGSTRARPGSDDVRNLVRYSNDGGKTWSEPTDITAVARDMKDPDWRSSYVGPAGAIQTHAGRLVAAAWKVDKPWGVFAIFSEDHGRTWQRGAEVPGCGGDEDQVVELADGRLLMDIRQKTEPRRWFAESADGGLTWSNPQLGIAAPPCCCSLVRLSGNKDSQQDCLIWTGPLGPGRNRLVLRISTDEGKSFGPENIIAESSAAYSSLTALPGGVAGVLWERGNYKFITFTRLGREFIAAPITP